MITAKNIHKYYDNLHVLKGVDLHIKQGEIVSIVGSSGAGKTTLLQILGTLDFPEKKDNTSLELNNQNVLLMKDKALSKFRNKHLGFIFQFHQLLPEFTALENVCIPAYIAGNDKTTTEKEAMKLLDYLGLSDRIHHKPNELSGGEQQALAIGRALMSNPRLLLLDEVSLGLAPIIVKKLYEILPRIRATGCSLIYVEQDTNQALSASEYAYCLLEGRVSLEGKPADLSREQIASAYFGIGVNK